MPKGKGTYGSKRGRPKKEMVKIKWNPERLKEIKVRTLDIDPWTGKATIESSDFTKEEDNLFLKNREKRLSKIRKNKSKSKKFRR